MSFLGGLPGQDGHEPEPVRMIGRRSEDFVILSGGPWAIFVEAGSCLLIDREGNRVGKLERVQRSSPTLGAPPPEGALVLFDGSPFHPDPATLFDIAAKESVSVMNVDE